jgi:hypothetical protein
MWHFNPNRMIRQTSILIFILTLGFTAYSQTVSDIEKLKTSKTIFKIDTSIITILPFDKDMSWAVKTGKKTDLTTNELLQIENLINKCISEYNLKQKIQFQKLNDEHPKYKLDKNNFFIDLINYKRQYIATLNINGEKEIWINCFCDKPPKNWRKKLVMVLDGGNCYFNLKINLTQNNYYELFVNGDA